MLKKSVSGHLKIDRYGDFLLTDAIRPAPSVPIIPREGYRIHEFRDKRTGMHVPVLTASVSREKLFDVYLSLLEPLGPLVDVVLETSHQSSDSTHRDLLREQIDLPVLLSHFCDFEDLLLNDGCTGAAVISGSATAEVQFDEHKLLMVYAHDLEPFETCLKEAGVRRDDGLQLITEAEHLHSTRPEFFDEFERMCCRVGVGEYAEQVSW